MCVSIPETARVTCTEQQTELFRLMNGQILCSYKSTIKADTGVKTFMFAESAEMSEFITDYGEIPCHASAIDLSQPKYRGLSANVDGIKSIIIDRDDGSVTGVFMISEVQKSHEIPKKCLKSLINNSDSNIIQKRLFGNVFDNVHTDGDISSILMDDGVLEFFCELNQALLEVWEPGLNLRFVIPMNNTNEGTLTKINIVYKFPSNTNRFPLFGLEHNHPIDQRSFIEPHHLVTNIKDLRFDNNNTCLKIFEMYELNPISQFMIQNSIKDNYKLIPSHEMFTSYNLSTIDFSTRNLCVKNHHKQQATEDETYKNRIKSSLI